MKKVALADVPWEGVSHDPEIRKKVLLRKGDLPYLANFSQARFLPGQTAHAHTHDDMYEVFLVESGSGLITVDGEAHALEPGTCLAVEPGEMHEVHNPGPHELVLTYFGINL